MCSKWIFGDFKYDLGLLYLPGIISVLLVVSLNLSQPTLTFYVFSFIALALLDSGHVYTTVFRTYLNPLELKRKKKYYIITPIIIFTFFFTWIYFKIPHLGALIVYSTIYHNVRQFYGLSKWYQKINHTYDKNSDLFIYALMGVSFIGVYFRTGFEHVGYYTEFNKYMYPSIQLENLIRLVYFLILGCLFFYEFKKYRIDKKIEFPRILSIVAPSLLYGYCFLYSHSLYSILFPLMISHGFSYICLVGKSMMRVGSSRKFLGVCALLILVATVFGTSEYYLEEVFLGNKANPIVLALISSVVLTPLFCHYVFDAFLWRSGHPEAKLIMCEG